MKSALKQISRQFRRNGIFYSHDSRTGEQKSQHTRDKAEAHRLLNAKNEAVHNPSVVNLQIARTYVAASNPEMLTRTWRSTFDAMTPLKENSTQERWIRAGKDKAYELIWDITLMETQPESLLKTMKVGTVATNVFLRRMHNFAIDMNWLLGPILPKKKWPKIKHKETRATTPVEHELILAGENDPERRDYYDLLWYTGGSQGDIASLHAAVF